MNDYSESLLVHFRRSEALKQESIGLPSFDLNLRQLCDLELLLNRAFYPLDGYLDQADCQSVLSQMRLTDNTMWPMPICLDVPGKIANSLKTGDKLGLNDQEGFLLAILTISDIWQPDKRQEAAAIFGTDNAKLHIGVKNLYEKTNEWYAGGTLEGISLPIHYDFKEIRLSPAESHRRFSLNGWRHVIGFHTDAYLHCAHKEMILKAAREAGANIFLQPVAGLDHPGNLDHYTHVRCYQEFIKKFPRNMISLGLLPLASRWAGPREALWQAIIKRNFGCTHFLVADDQGDPFASQLDKENFYPAGAAQKL
ncbi:MAG: adenylyltransferase, partial [Desulfobulbaceae bacterium]|nr:adenylyltransferase [Desulfobulbaceae bacterium]